MHRCTRTVSLACSLLLRLRDRGCAGGGGPGGAGDRPLDHDRLAGARRDATDQYLHAARPRGGHAAAGALATPDSRRHEGSDFHHITDRPGSTANGTMRRSWRGHREHRAPARLDRWPRRMTPRIEHRAARRRLGRVPPVRRARSWMPEIRQRYRVTEETAIVGESLAGGWCSRRVLRRARAVRHAHRHRPERVVGIAGRSRSRPQLTCSSRGRRRGRSTWRPRTSRTCSATGRNNRRRAAPGRRAGGAPALRADARRAPQHDLPRRGAASLPHGPRADRERGGGGGGGGGRTSAAPRRRREVGCSSRRPQAARQASLEDLADRGQSSGACAAKPKRNAATSPRARWTGAGGELEASPRRARTAGASSFDSEATFSVVRPRRRPESARARLPA